MAEFSADADAEAERVRREAEAEAERVQQEVEAATADPATQTEWIRQSNMIYAGLAGVGLVLVQPFLTATSLSPSALVCVIAFAVSTPLLAALLLVNRQEEFRKRATRSRLVQVGKALAQGSAFVGVVAAFWHISWIAGVVLLVASCVGVSVHSAGYVQLEYDSRFRRRKHPQQTQTP